MRVIVTGGAGFIGSALVRHLVLERGYDVLNIDKLTYAGNLASLRAVEGRNTYSFLQADICDRAAMESRQLLITFDGGENPHGEVALQSPRHRLFEADLFDDPKNAQTFLSRRVTESF